MGQEGRVPQFDRLFRAGWSIVQTGYVANHAGRVGAALSLGWYDAERKSQSNEL